MYVQQKQNTQHHNTVCIVVFSHHDSRPLECQFLFLWDGSIKVGKVKRKINKADIKMCRFITNFRRNRPQKINANEYVRVSWIPERKRLVTMDEPFEIMGERMGATIKFKIETLVHVCLTKIGQHSHLLILVLFFFQMWQGHYMEPEKNLIDVRTHFSFGHEENCRDSIYKQNTINSHLIWVTWRECTWRYQRNETLTS